MWKDKYEEGPTWPQVDKFAKNQYLYVFGFFGQFQIEVMLHAQFEISTSVCYQMTVHIMFTIF